MNAFEAVDGYLRATYRLELEDVLCEGCAFGRIGGALASAARIIPRLIRSEAEDDGGEFALYEGVLILDGLWYRFGCRLFIDGGGLRFLSEISDFEAVEWKIRLAATG